jgi:hypothetical protein
LTGGGSKKVREAAVRSNRLTGRLDFFDTFLIKQKSMAGMMHEINPYLLQKKVCEHKSQFYKKWN